MLDVYFQKVLTAGFDLHEIHFLSRSVCVYVYVYPQLYLYIFKVQINIVFKQVSSLLL